MSQYNIRFLPQIEDDAYQEDLGYSRGTIGKSSTGRVRLPQIDEKTKVRISKTLQKNLQKQQQYGGATSIRRQVSGTASSVAFTPLQVSFFFLNNIPAVRNLIPVSRGV